jgi:CheY-like chemotaxis protein
MDGRMVLTKLKTNYDLCKIPVVLFTTSSSELHKSFAEKQQVELITKPPSVSRLTEAIQKIMQIAS